jgi:hypothetical protein
MIPLLLAALLLGCSQHKGLRAVRQSFPGALVANVPDQPYRFIMIYSGKVYYVKSDGWTLGPVMTTEDYRVVQLFDDSVTVERP